jgi:ATP-binding cassette subfamily B protein
MAQPHFLVPEVVQTSEMDCGPAALKAMLEGYGIRVSYGRLREACQTQVDGTSIDTLEDIAVQLGLEAEQTMLPRDHLPLREANALPALVVVTLPNGMTHFVVVWSINGPFLQVMDPGKGRRWTTWSQLENELFIHRFPVSAEAWREWAGSESFIAPLRTRLRELRIEGDGAKWIQEALQDPTWQNIAALDATVRMLTSVVEAGGLEHGQETTNVLKELLARGALDVPDIFWFVTPTDDADMILMRGVVLVRILGKRTVAIDEAAMPEPLPSELAAALAEESPRPELEVWRAVKQDGWLLPMLIVLALAVAALGGTLQAVLMQGVLQGALGTFQIEQRNLVAIGLVVFFGVLLGLEFPLNAAIQRMGRRLEARLRLRFLEKIPRLGDRYFHSRLASDMANRAHSLAALRTLPALASGFVRRAFLLIFTSIGVLVLDPANAPFAMLFSLSFIIISFVTTPFVQEYNLRVNTLTGALARFYLDALLGLIPLRTHGAERAFRREHEALLSEWMRANLGAGRMQVVVFGVGALFFALFTIAMVFSTVARGSATSAVLLLFYWTLTLPVLAEAMSQSIQQYPSIRNTLLRILEPLGAPEENEIVTGESMPRAEPVIETPLKAVAIEFQDVEVHAGGHSILSSLTATVTPGEHIAIVGVSGAGKSSLVGLLLGWHRPVTGQVLVDGTLLDGAQLQILRRATAWVDPAVQLWNTSLVENLMYGREGGDVEIGPLIAQADLYNVMARLPEGLRTPLGEGGGLVSGGEGQRVRLGRALNRPDAHLVILDEPFRGLDREQRRSLLGRARAYWHDATLLCITHDVGETQAFDRVWVMENGQLVEDAPPAVLAAQADSRYRTMLDGEMVVRERLWEGAAWRHLWVENGRVTETAGT